MKPLKNCLKPGILVSKVFGIDKGAAFLNRKAFNRWGIHGMYSGDGFLKSMIASMNSRGSLNNWLTEQW